MAYGEMKLEPRGGIGGGDGVYEDPDKLVNTTKISRYIYTFAGFIISDEGYKIDPSITDAIAKFPTPSN